MPKTTDCSTVLRLLFCYPLFCWSSWKSTFTLDVILLVGSLMSAGFEGLVENTVVRPFRVVVSVGLWNSDPI